MANSGIYLIRNVINNKKYVGSTCSSQGFTTRWRKHKECLRRNKHQNSYLQNSWNKYGEDSFEFSILEECPDDMLVVREQSWINYYQSNNRTFGYNLREAGNNGPLSEETKAKLSKAMKGRKGYWLGKHLSEETKQKLSACNIGKKNSLETRQKISRSNIGKKCPKTKEQIDKHRSSLIKYYKEHPLSEDKLNTLRTNWIGKKHSEETKLKMAASRRLWHANKKLSNS